MQKIISENTRLVFMISNDHNHYFIYNWISHFKLSLLLFFIEIYINDIIHTFLNYIGESLGWSLTFALFIRFYYISDDS